MLKNGDRDGKACTSGSTSCVQGCEPVTRPMIEYAAKHGMLREAVALRKRAPPLKKHYERGVEC